MKFPFALFVLAFALTVTIASAYPAENPKDPLVTDHPPDSPTNFTIRIVNQPNGSKTEDGSKTKDVPQGTISSLWALRQKQISEGVNTIVSGARGIAENIEKILRGSFKIPYNSHVRSTANGVLDAVFGNFRRAPPTEAS